MDAMMRMKMPSPAATATAHARPAASMMNQHTPMIALLAGMVVSHKFMTMELVLAMITGNTTHALAMKNATTMKSTKCTGQLVATMMMILVTTTARTSEPTTMETMLLAHIWDGVSATQTASTTTTWKFTGITVGALLVKNSATMTTEIMALANPAQTTMETMFMLTTMNAGTMACQTPELQLVLLNASACTQQIQNTALVATTLKITDKPSVTTWSLTALAMKKQIAFGIMAYLKSVKLHLPINSGSQPELLWEPLLPLACPSSDDHVHFLKIRHDLIRNKPELI